MQSVPPINFQNTMLKPLGIGIAFGLIPIFTDVFCLWSPARHSEYALTWAGIINLGLGLFALVAFLALCVCLVVATEAHFRGRAPIKSLSVAIYFLSVFLLIKLGLFIAETNDELALKKVTDRARPLISAIQTFQAKTGRPPATLSELKPTYIKEIPSTGIVDSPEYEYKRLDDTSAKDIAPWRLDVDFLWNAGGLGVFYFPTHRYGNHAASDGWAFKNFSG